MFGHEIARHRLIPLLEARWLGIGG